MIDESILKEEIFKELARRDFWYYCMYMDNQSNPFYLEDRKFLKDLANTLQKFVEQNEKNILVINMPPRHGKSYTGGRFVEWLLGKNNKLKIMTGSYNETLSSNFAKQVRDTIGTQKTSGIRVYSDIFPKTKIKYGEASMNKWALEGSSQSNYLATSPTGTATGFGANILIIDDLIKNAEEAFNINVLNKHIDWFTNTMLSRVESGFKIIIIMTRWATNDLAGFVLENYENVEHINYVAVQENGSMLCEGILSKKDFDFKTKNMAKEIVYANYQQEPIDIQGRLYQKFKTYIDVPWGQKQKIAAYCDTADEGKDYLCNIIYVDCKDSVYILDIIYTKEHMETTEEMVAQACKSFEVNVADIESNNGGRGFARNVEKRTKELGNYKTVFNSFFQKGNKNSRILSNSAWVENNVYYPEGWENKYPEFYQAVSTYQKEGKNAHDDAPDALSGIAEMMCNPSGIEFGI